MKNQTLAIIEILVANIFWGLGFVATIWALESLSTSAIVFYRFFTVALITLVWLLIQRQSFQSYLLQLKISFTPGFWLGSTLLLQTWGLKYTTASKSAFITVLYVIITPVIESFRNKKKLPFEHWLACLVALSGIALMTKIDDLQLNWGDLLTLMCAFTAAFHIIAVGEVTKKSTSSVMLNGMQSFWACLFAFCFFPFTSQWDLTALTPNALIGIFLLIFGSTLIGFYLQMKAQKKISASTAAVLFLLESPFSAVFAFFLINESLDTKQIIGAVLILAGCILAIRVAKMKKNRNTLTLGGL